jgi:tetratricopeptide (TPR) repeat protein
MSVKAWTESIVIPTYGIGKPEKNPMFLEKRVYQGSSGVVYPNPVIEKILDEKKDKEWNAIFMENDFLKIMILPELGGRIQMAFDKTKNRHFVYYNQVIKPALVGLTGPWISGGIEFNWPQHHRPSTFEPVDSTIEENCDGSVTVWCSEVERMFRTRGMAGFTLYPDMAYLEIKVKIYNRTNHPQTFLWWANPAVKVNDEYQSVFPPDVHAVFDHGKRDVSEFPIAKGTYYKVDYSPGTDISRYKNIPVPTSYMAITSKYNFVGGYEHDTKGGLLHVANHHISPGKKQWTWGNGDFGHAWDRNLTDEDGPYIELMCGVYTDNQPDFSWLMPGEEKTFSQYFMPYRDLGVVNNATKEAMINLEVENGQATIRAYTTASYSNGKVLLEYANQILAEETFDFHPATSFEKTVALPLGVKNQDLYVAVKTTDGRVLVDWHPEPDVVKQLPAPAKAAKDPSEIESNEQLFHTGLHLEQYRHATYDPRPYYEEALKRDAGDSRCNNALGLWYLRRGQFFKAEKYFRSAIHTLTERNPNPMDGEPFFNLGLALLYQEKEKEAYDNFYKSVWNAAWQDSGYFQLARLAMKNHRWEEALDLIDRSLSRNTNNHKARHLKVTVLRKLERLDEAHQLAVESLRLDRFNFGMLFEKGLLKIGKQHLHVDQLSVESGADWDTFNNLIRGNIHNYIEFALDYAFAGLYDEAIQFIEKGIGLQTGNVYPLAYYFNAWFYHKAGKEAKAREMLEIGSKACPDFCFPNQPEALLALTWAIKAKNEDFKAWYYLGNYWYDAKNYEEAITCWEAARKINSRFPTARRNLALAYYNKRQNGLLALEEMEAAFDADPSDSRILFELDQLYKRLNRNPEERLNMLEKHSLLVENRDDLYLERLTLLNHTGKFEKAFELLMKRKFHPWEGGEGKVSGQYVFSLTEMAKKAITNGEFSKALKLLEGAKQYPENLGEGKLFGKPENDINYWMGIALEKEGKREEAIQYWKSASKGVSEPAAAVFYNDPQPDSIFYQGLALLKLGRKNEAEATFNKLVDFGLKHISDQIKIDYFAVSLPDLLIWDADLDARNRIHCKYLIGLGYLGLGRTEEAIQYFSEVIHQDQSQSGAKIHLDGKRK